MKSRSLSLFALVAASAAPSAFAAEAVLQLKPNVAMAELARVVTDPASPRFHVFYTPEEIRALAGPTDSEYAGLVQELTRSGLQITSESPTHLWLSVRGKRTALTQLSARAKSAFQSLDFSPTRLIEATNGLTPSRPRHHHLVRLPAEESPAAFAGNSPEVIRKFYGLDTLYAAGLSGRGQHIAIATYADFNLDDVNQYYQKNNIQPGPHVDKVAFNGIAPIDEGSALETELDAEFSGMVAPGAQIHVFTSAQNNDSGEEQMFTAILDDNRAKVVNYSWGSCESGASPEYRVALEAIFARAVAQGVNVLVASGDSGSSCNGDGKTVAGMQAASPYVVAVGGTTIPASLSGMETAWSGSGSGVSAFNALPSWQTGMPYPNRAYPDVSYNADPHSGQPLWAHEGAGEAKYIVVGGTSIAAPQWSGFLALVGEARGTKPLGFLNPILYGLNEAGRASVLSDVLTGSNGAYNAGSGFDAVTGLGSMKGDALLNLLRTQ